MTEFVLVCGLPRSGTREITDIFNGIPGVCIQGEITKASFDHTCDFINNIVSDNKRTNRDRLVKKGAALFSDSLGLAGKKPLLSIDGELSAVGFKCPNSLGWYKEILSIAKLLNFKLHVIICVREPAEVYRSLMQMDWYSGGYKGFDTMCGSLVDTYTELLGCTDPMLASVQIFNLNHYVNSDRVEYMGHILNHCDIQCGNSEVHNAIGSATNRNSTVTHKTRKEVDHKSLNKNMAALRLLAKGMSGLLENQVSVKHIKATNSLTEKQKVRDLAVGGQYVYLHVGLPKTATTFLQNKVLSKFDGVNYISRYRAKDFFSEKVGKRLSVLLKKDPVIWEDEKYVSAFSELLLSAQENRPKPIVISDENFSIDAKFFTMAKGRDEISPRLLLEHIKFLQKIAVKAGFFGLKVIWTVREHSSWFASRYAQSASQIPNSSQEDFERRLKRIVSLDVVKGTKFEWLDYSTVDRMYRDVLGDDGFIALSMEALESNPLQFFDELDGFLNLEGRLSSWVSRELTFEKKNSRSTGYNQWTLNLDGEKRYITLTPEVDAMIIERYRDYLL
jgi:hypothetical protein